MKTCKENQLFKKSHNYCGNPCAQSCIHDWAQDRFWRFKALLDTPLL